MRQFAEMKRRRTAQPKDTLSEPNSNVNEAEADSWRLSDGPDQA
jgi:hypothetical protein